jgi:UDP-N-acetylmuramoyl-tripeptide--D-alanyl-D-alanine ligase
VIATVGAVVLTAAVVAQATDGRLVAGASDRRFEHVSTDTRSITPGSLFIALRGERFDGHDFIARAVERGATGLMVSAVPQAATGDSAVIVVHDTVTALQSLARFVRRQSGSRVIAITGSAGKTTTKEVTAALLAVRYRVFRNRGNLNNHIGLPLSLLELRDGPDVAVVELGMNHEGEIRTLVDIAEPNVRVWTNVGDAHIGYFGSRDAVARAKAEVLEQATADTLVVANADDPLVAAHVAASTARQVTFGESVHATVRAVDIVDRGFDGTSARVTTPAGELRLAVPLAGRAQLMNVLAAVAVAVEFEIPTRDIEARVAALVPVPRRGAVSLLAPGARLVDDSYNASPAAVLAMLSALAATPTSGRRIAVLGEMRELGESSRALHEQCGRAAVSAGVDELVAVGGDAAMGLADGALAAGLDPAHVHRFATSEEAASAVTRLVRAGDLVLVKGSRATRTDIVSDRLKGSA